MASVGHIRAMNWFSATTSSQADVAAGRGEVWHVLTDPEALAELTPLLRRIDVDGDLWRWCFTQVPLLGLAVTPAFTERMTFHEMERIDYEHAPPDGSRERFGVEGWYSLADAAEGTRLAVSMTVRVQLPLAKVAAPAVTRVMDSVLARTGDGFSRNFERRLGAA